MAINFNYELDFKLDSEPEYSDWIARIITSESRSFSEMSFIFCNDDYLLKLNKEFLNHDTLTDIITFDYTEDAVISGDIFISIERVKENASELGTQFDEEILRVMAHGVLHLMGYKDKKATDRAIMREKENDKIKMFHVEH